MMINWILVKRQFVFFVGQTLVSRIFHIQQCLKMLMNKFCVLIILSLITGLVISSDSSSSCDNSGEGNCPKKRMKRYLGFKQGARTFVRDRFRDWESMSNWPLIVLCSFVSMLRITSWRWIRYGHMLMVSGRTLTFHIRCQKITKSAGEMSTSPWSWCWISKNVLWIV